MGLCIHLHQSLACIPFRCGLFLCFGVFFKRFLFEPVLLWQPIFSCICVFFPSELISASCTGLLVNNILPIQKRKRVIRIFDVLGQNWIAISLFSILGAWFLPLSDLKPKQTNKQTKNNQTLKSGKIYISINIYP